MSTNRGNHLKTSLNSIRSRGTVETSINSINNRSQGIEHIESGSSRFTSWIEGMEHNERGSSQFLSWINGKGPFVPQPLPADDISQVVVLDDFCHGLTAEMFEKENLERSSSQFGAHPSPYFAPVNYFSEINENVFPTQCDEKSDAPIVVVGDTVRATRYTKDTTLRRIFTDESVVMKEIGTCIWSNGTHPWLDKSCGVMWVAVHGMNSICVVTRNEDLEQKVTQCMHALGETKKFILDVFMDGIIYKVEDLAEQMFDKSSKKPFGAVSVIQGNNHKGSGHEASGVEYDYDKEKAIKFVQKEMESNTTFTFDKTVQTAISGFQHLFRQKFKAHEIRVIVWKEDGDIIKELPSRDYRSIEEQLAVIRARYR